MPKISILSTNLSANCTLRCLSLAEALRPRYDVELVGTIFGNGDETARELWTPIQDTDLAVKAVTGDLLPGYLQPMRALLALITGDVIIACKPRFPSFGVALIKRLQTGTPVILDVDDDEIAMMENHRAASVTHKLRDTSGFLFTHALHPFHRRADTAFCVSEHFRRVYGGVIVPHGRDPAVFDPARYDRARMRRQFGFGDDDVVIGFIGTPRPHKGADLIAASAARVGDPRLRILVVDGSTGERYTEALKRQFGNWIAQTPFVPFKEVPAYLSAVDVVVLPQRVSRETEGQMPGKLTDAMAMGKTVIASATADIPKYLDGCGLLIPPDDEKALTESLAWVMQNRDAARDLGLKARDRYLRDLTYDAMLAAMAPEIERVLRTRRAA